MENEIYCKNCKYYIANWNKDYVKICKRLSTITRDGVGDVCLGEDKDIIYCNDRNKNHNCIYYEHKRYKKKWWHLGLFSIK